MVWVLAWLALTFAHRTASVASEPPRMSRSWWLALLLVLALQLVFGEVHMLLAEIRESGGGGSGGWSRLEWLSGLETYWWCAALLWPPLVVVISSEATKRHDRRLFDRSMQRARLLFDCRLGMYSPALPGQ